MKMIVFVDSRGRHHGNPTGGYCVVPGAGVLVQAAGRVGLGLRSQRCGPLQGWPSGGSASTVAGRGTVVSFSPRPLLETVPLYQTVSLSTCTKISLQVHAL